MLLNKCKVFHFLPLLLSQYKHHKEESDPHTRIEGKETDDWLCIDFGKYLWIWQIWISAWALCWRKHLTVNPGCCGEVTILCCLEFQLLLLELIEILNKFSLKITGTEKKAVATLQWLKQVLIKITLMEREKLLQSIFSGFYNPCLGGVGALCMLP